MPAMFRPPTPRLWFLFLSFTMVVAGTYVVPATAKPVAPVHSIDVFDLTKKVDANQVSMF
jgi:hypothetical protein